MKSDFKNADIPFTGIAFVVISNHFLIPGNVFPPLTIYPLTGYISFVVCLVLFSFMHLTGRYELCAFCLLKASLSANTLITSGSGPLQGQRRPAVGCYPVSES